MIGQNDLCRLTCKYNSSSYEKSSRVQSARKFGRNIKRAVDRLYKNLPKTFVNIVLPSGNITVLLIEIQYYSVTITCPKS